MAKYAIVNQSNIVENIVAWDGISQWSPPEGCTAMPIENADCIIWSPDDDGVNQQIEAVGMVDRGALWDGQKFINAEPPPPPEQPQTSGTQEL